MAPEPDRRAALAAHLRTGAVTIYASSRDAMRCDAATAGRPLRPPPNDAANPPTIARTPIFRGEPPRIRFSYFGWFVSENGVATRAEFCRILPQLTATDRTLPPEFRTMARPSTELFISPNKQAHVFTLHRFTAFTSCRGREITNQGCRTSAAASESVPTARSWRAGGAYPVED